MTWLHVKKNLSTFEKPELINIISQLYSDYSVVKERLEFYGNRNEEEIFKKYQRKVIESFFPKRGYDLRLKDARKAISDFKKLGVSAVWIADLMMVFVEMWVKFTSDYGDIDEPFYCSIEGMLTDLLKFAQKENLLNQFQTRAAQMVDKTDGIGWGFWDMISQIYHEYYQ